MASSRWLVDGREYEPLRPAANAWVPQLERVPKGGLDVDPRIFETAHSALPLGR